MVRSVGILVCPTVGAEEHTIVVMTVGMAVSDTRRRIVARTGGCGFWQDRGNADSIGKDVNALQDACPALVRELDLFMRTADQGRSGLRCRTARRSKWRAAHRR
jgi:hypothetical protein